MQPKVVNSTPSAKAFSSSGSETSRVTSTKSGELPGDDWQLLDLKSKNQRCIVALPVLREDHTADARSVLPVK